MYTKSNSRLSCHLVIALTMSSLLGACSSDDDSQNAASLGPAYTGEITPTEEFDMPALQPDGKGGYFVYAAKNGNFPAVPAARVLHSDEQYGLPEADQPPKLEVGDAVSLRWKMYGLRSGELVEDSDTLFTQEPAVIVLGGGLGGTAEVPDEVHDALLGQRIGDKIQVLFQYQMEGLPEYLEADDAYTLVVEIISKS